MSSPLASPASVSVTSPTRRASLSIDTALVSVYEKSSEEVSPLFINVEWEHTSPPRNSPEPNGGWQSMEFISMITQQFVFSRYNKAFWGFQIVANIFALNWTLFHHHQNTDGHLLHEGWFVAVEVALNLMMVVDVTLRAIALGREFCLQWWNVVDGVVMVLCITATIFFLTRSSGGDDALMVDEVAIVVRSAIIFLRYCIFLKTKRSVDSAVTVNVEFSLHEGEASPMLSPYVVKADGCPPQGSPDEMHWAQDQEELAASGDPYSQESKADVL